MSVETLYCTPLLPAQKTALNRRVFASRVSALEYLLGAVSRPEVTERLGDRQPRLQAFLAELSRRLEEEPESFQRLMDHWGLVFFLSRLEDTGTRDGGQLDRLLGNLCSLLIADRLQTAPAGSDTGWATATVAIHEQGRIYDLLGQGWLSLPPSGQGTITFSPFVRLAGWDLPLIDDSFALGAEPRRRSLPPEETWQPPDLAGGLERAYGTLHALWPEVLEWVHAMVPAFVDMGLPPNRTSQRSESYGPGSPVFLSTAATDLQLAEAVVHELQHQRLLLFGDSVLFRLWGDTTPRFVSPWRPDVRPSRGLYLALHAFLAVNELRLRALGGRRPEPRAALQILQTHCMNLFTFRTLLDHDRFSPAGERIFAEWGHGLSRHHEAVRPMIGDEMQRWVDGFFDRHVETVAAHGLELANASLRYRAWDDIAQDAAATTGSLLHY